MKTNKIFGLAAMVIFIAIILALGINHILNKLTPYSLEKTATPHPLIPSKVEPPKTAVDESIKFEEKGKVVDIDTIEDNKDTSLTEEGLPSEEATRDIVAPIPSGNTTGPPVEPGKITKELPAFAPFGSHSGPSSATTTTVSRGNNTQGPTSVAEDTKKTYQDISAIIPSGNNGGPPIDPKKTYKELPPFTPVTNTTGPIATDKNK